MSRIKLSDILKAVMVPIKMAFPDRYQYIGQRPEKFKRPSFFLQLVTTNRIRQNIGTDETEVYLTLTIHEELDISRNGSQVAALDDQDRVMDLFRLGTLKVSDRVLPIDVSNGGQNKGESYVEMTVTLRDGVGYDPEEGLDLMEEVNSILQLNAEIEVKP